MRIKMLFKLMIGYLCAVLTPLSSAGESLELDTPLKQAGYEPLWEENFTNGAFDNMKFRPAHGSLDIYSSYAIPGAFRFGHAGATGMTEQQLNYYRDKDDPQARTLELFICPSRAAVNESWGGGRHRIFFRPRRLKNGGHLHMAEPEVKSWFRGPQYIVFDEEGEMVLDERGKPDVEREHKNYSRSHYPGEWVYVVFSENVDPDTKQTITHMSLNGEVLTYEGVSANPDTLPQEVWSMEWNSGLGPDDWWYLRQIRAYREYIDADTIREVSETYMEQCIASQPPLRELDRIEPDLYLPDRDLYQYLNITQPPADGIPEEAVTLQGDDLTFRLQSHGAGRPPFSGRVWTSDDPDPWNRNVLVQFPPMRVLKVEYDNRGVGEAEGWIQTNFKIGAGLSGWMANLAMYPIAQHEGQTEGKSYVFYPDIHAKSLKINDTVTLKDGIPLKKWFVNLEGIKITGIPLDE